MSRSLWDRYAEADRELAAALAACGRERESVLLLPVSKTVGAEKIAELYERGIRVFGENRANVLAEKAGAWVCPAFRRRVWGKAGGREAQSRDGGTEAEAAGLPGDPGPGVPDGR